MKVLFVIVLVFISSSFSVHQPMGDELNWKADRKLTWDDFKGKPEANAGLLARVNWNITYKYKLKSSGPAFNVRCYIDRKKSWVKETAKNEMVLAHQQLVFDIAELHARELRKRFATHNFDKKNFDEDIKKIFQEVITTCKAAQREYQAETKQGWIKPAQEQWYQKTQAGLKKLEAFID